MTSNDDMDPKQVEQNIKVVMKVVDNGRKFTPRKDIHKPTAKYLNRRWRQGKSTSTVCLYGGSWGGRERRIIGGKSRRLTAT